MINNAVRNFEVECYNRVGEAQGSGKEKQGQECLGMRGPALDTESVGGLEGAS